MAADQEPSGERPRVNALLLTLICKNLDGNAVVDAMVAEDGGGGEGGKAKITAAQAQAKAASVVKAFTKVGFWVVQDEMMSRVGAERVGRVPPDSAPGRWKGPP